MEFIQRGDYLFISSLTDEEWKQILSIEYAGEHRKLLEKAREENRCWLPGSIHQNTYDLINTRWKRFGLPFRLRSDPQNASWGDPDKKLRFQTLNDWELAVKRRRRLV